MGCSSCCQKVGPCHLSHDEPERFDRSQWCPDGQVSFLYAFYRLMIAVIFVAGITAHMINANQGAKWFIYMTDQGILLLTIHYILEAILVLTRYTWEKVNKEERYHSREEITWIYKVSWAMNSCFFTIALWISIIYWAALHKFVVENNLMKTDLARGLNIFLHAINSISCLLDIFISGRPWRVMHFYFAVIFGLYYTFFSVIYWAAGGTGICKEVNGVVQCDKFIYPILDWEDHPGMAVGVICGGCLFIPVLHCVWVGLSKLRANIYLWTLPAESPITVTIERQPLRTTEI